MLEEAQKPTASISLDVDDHWTYLKSNADLRWIEYPSYLGWVLPRILDFFNGMEIKLTFFVVGKDLSFKRNHPLIKNIVTEGHEIGNHSYNHDQWMTQYSEDRIEEEIHRTEELIFDVAGRRPLGYRGPGYSFSDAVAKVLIRRNYLYDCSTWPTFVGPISQLYFSLKSNFRKMDSSYRNEIFGSWKDAFRPNNPFSWYHNGLSILEIPVTTMPLFRIPIHATYILYLYQFNKKMALSYFKTAINLCRWFKVTPSILLHCMDYIGKNDPVQLPFMPNMNLAYQDKMICLQKMLDIMMSQYQLVPLEEQANQLLIGHKMTSLIKSLKI